MPAVKYWQAINRALADALEGDERVCVIGEDVGAPGGPFGATLGLQERFGTWRVRDTPISEAAIVGTAVGAAMTGLRPVVEVMFMDFIGLALDQLVNQAAKVSYMSDGAYHVPMVVRTVVGAGRGTGPQHSQSFEGWLGSVPGLKVAWPSGPSDAYWLLRAAIDDDDPVVVIESLRAWNLREEITDQADPAALRQAAIRRPGTHLSLVTWGGAVPRSLDAATAMAERGIEAEVVDLRWIWPLDYDTVLSSLARTGRLVVVQDSVAPFGVGAEIAALASSPAAFNVLKAPVRRISAPFEPVPFPPDLEQAYFPSVDRIVRIASEVVEDKF
jgi:pyruvate dehydrogenase E1 component beta subunit